MHRENVHRPVIGVLCTVALAIFYYWLGDNNTHDQASAALIAVTFGFATAVVLYYTLEWRWRAVGILVVAMGVALTYFLLWGKGAEYINFNQLVTKSILRAALDFGGLVTFLGLLKYVIDRQRGKHVRLLGWLDEGDDQ